MAARLRLVVVRQARWGSSVVSGASGRQRLHSLLCGPRVCQQVAPGKRNQDQEGQGHTWTNNHLVRNIGTNQINYIAGFEIVAKKKGHA
jgi:hypothetical protein